MDMARYVGLLGMWLPEPVLPDVEPFAHSHDLLLRPVVELLGGGPDHLELERGLVSQRISDDRVATGWLGDDVMMGGEEGGRWRAQGQYHPATVHWADGDGGCAWLRVRSPHLVAALVPAAGVLEVEGRDLTIDSSAPFPGSIEETDDGLVIRWVGR
jgi:hypothetical protein